MKKYLVILIVFILLILSLVVIFSSSSRNIPKPKDVIQFQSPTPTPQPILEVVSVIPAANSTDIPFLTNININFSRPLNDTEKSTSTVSITPLITGNTSWSTDNKTLTFTPAELLSPNQQYTVKVTYPSRTYSTTFTTITVDKTTPEDQIKIQLNTDRQVAKQRDQFLQKYPWFMNLPLEGTGYFVYFLPNQSKPGFVAKLYPEASSNTSTDDQIRNWQEAIEAKLTSIGVDLSVYNIEWEVNYQ